MSKSVERDLSRIGWLDYVLMAIGSCLAAFSAGMSIQAPAVGYFSAVLIVIGTLVSCIVRVLTIKSPWIKIDGFVYSFAVIGSIYFAGSLAHLMPENGFPREMAAAGWLSWMLILGSFATWQDATLLFQAIPALALFGLVGCYDTYKFVTFNFFAFLICLATLFARAHGRQMLRQAAQSGYFTRGLAPGTPIPSVETTPGLALKLKHGPWRWVAGPEWALASAIAVACISLLGAPMIRQSVSGVAGLVTLNPPPMRNPITAASGATPEQISGAVRIGRGPNHSGSPRPVFEAKLDHMRYLREQTYQTYNGKGWQNPSTAAVPTTPDQSTPTDLAVTEMKDSTQFDFELDLIQSVRLLPLPAEVMTVSTDRGSINQTDGTYELGALSVGDVKVTGKSIEPSPNVKPIDAFRSPAVAHLLDSSHIAPRVAKLAYDLTRNDKSDYEKAVAIRKEIAKRILYNLDADPTPSGQDPIEYALFEKHEAYCDIYASAMVMMARAAGIPARYCQGYLPDERRSDSKNSYVLSTQDYHAWAELMFKNVGWVVFDPTIEASAKDGEGLGDVGDSSPWYQHKTILIAIDFLIVLGVIAFVTLLIRNLNGWKKVKNPTSEVGKAYIGFGKLLERASGRRRPIGQTADEFLESARLSLGDGYDLALSINEQLVAMLYSPALIEASGIINVREQMRQLTKILKSQGPIQQVDSK